MGLTVHYTLKLAEASPREVRSMLERVRERALTLKFAEVGPLEPIDPDPPDDEWPEGLTLVQRGEQHYDVRPNRGFYFHSLPAEGTETATFGLAEYPKTIVIEGGRRIRTNLSGWSWHSFCKTQYASNPRYGGVENFVRGHVGLIELLDAVRALGVETQVHDEGHYAEHRDVDRLRSEVEGWNGLVAGFVGRLKDALPGESAAPILDYPNFEHLEADARKES